MKIGILTFHWATNYGAILQAYALQEFLKCKGHEVRIIDYKPKHYDNDILQYAKSPKRLVSYFMNYSEIRKQRVKESNLQNFRRDYLNLTNRLYNHEDVNNIAGEYDILISGSDQILNPQYTLIGELHPTSTYYLDFECKAKKIGYAVSFGCTIYPAEACAYAKKWIHNFNMIGTREETGQKVLAQLEYNKGKQVVPDPTILYGVKMFDNMQLNINKQSYVYVYLLHGRKLDAQYVKRNATSIKYADIDVRNSTLQKWLEDIGSAGKFITNSYHGMIMAILFHVPFVILLEKKNGVGMNDRFTTLLSRLNLENRISNNEENDIDKTFSQIIDWNKVDNLVAEYRAIGEDFLNF